jgi:hypothetical protein
MIGETPSFGANSTPPCSPIGPTSSSPATCSPDGRRFETFVELEQRAEAERQRGHEEGVQHGLRQALERLIASGMAEDQARRCLGLS